MKTLNSINLIKWFGNLNDPRVQGRKKHLLIDIVMLAFCAVVANCDDWHEIELFAKHHEDWFRQFLRLPNGIPSHDTLERVFDRLDPVAFQRAFVGWQSTWNPALPIKQIAIDGKTLRRSFDRTKGWKALHVVSAWATEHQVSLGQVATDEKSNEITAIPELLEMLALNGALVTIDAMGCQKAIAATIIEAGGDYVLAVKDNHPRLAEDVAKVIDAVVEETPSANPADTYTVEEQKHGRIESRSYIVVPEVDAIRDRDLWPELKAVGICCYEREVNGVVQYETRQYICSRVLSAKEFAAAVRDHWGIENSLHWQLDVTFREDESRLRTRKGATNLACLRRQALSRLKQSSAKMSIKCKRKQAMMSTDFLEKILCDDAKLKRV